MINNITEKIALNQALKTLNFDEAYIIQALYYEDYPYSTSHIADHLYISTRQVQRIHKKALDKLRSELQR